MSTKLRQLEPIDFLKLLADDTRWRILETLSRSDYTVQELVTIVEKSDNLVSYHLGRLREYHLVTERRGDADGRDVYYSLNIEHLQDLYLSAGRALHPALCVSPEVAAESPATMPDPSPVRVLFLCTHNSARSQMAEALLRNLGKGKIEVYSAGTEPSPIRPEAVWAMAKLNIDISAQSSKHLSEFLGQSFDYVITVCDRAKESCPIFPNDVTRIHWSFPHPAQVEGSDETRRETFLATATQFLTRLRLLVTVIERDSVNKNP